MKIQIPYGVNYLSLEIPESNLAGVMRPEMKERAETTQVDLSAFEAFVHGDAPVLFIVNDGSRPTPTAQILEQLQPSLAGKEVSFLIATGSHRVPVESEMAFIFGDLLSKYHSKIHVHQADDIHAMKYYGATSRGTPVYLNKILDQFDKIVVIGSVEPHYFAGFTGGRKGFLPGVSGFETIEQNHKLAMHAGSEPLRLTGNPVHEDQAEVLSFLQKKLIFSIMTVLDVEDKIHAVFSGDMQTSFHQAVASCKAYYSVPLNEKADLVITVAAPPLDATLYQAHKAIENVRHVLRENGQLVLIAPCQEGLGNDTFVRLLQSFDTPQKVIDYVQTEYKLGYHKAARLAELVLSAKINIVSELDDALIESIFFHPLKHLQAFVDHEIKKNSAIRISVVDKATVVVPVLG